MTAKRVRRLFFLLALLCVATAGGCRTMRQIGWAVGEQEDPRERRREYESQRQHEQIQNTNEVRDVRDQRAQNEAEFRARNPGGKR